ncbi:MAG: hypothetical protein WC495_00555 [Patescibacteria group bacterium]|jgi:hypothetical protein
MQKKQKSKNDIPLLKSTPDREVVLDALQVISNPETKSINIKNSTAKKKPKEMEIPNVLRMTDKKIKKPIEFSEGRTQHNALGFEKNEQTFKKNLHRPHERYWLKTLPFFFVILVLGFICFLQAGLYFQPSIRSTAENIADKIYYPVAIVGTHIITYHDVQKERELLQVYTKAGFSFAGDETTLDAFAINKIVRDLYLQKGKKQYAVNVSDAVVEQAFVNLFGAQSASEDARIVSQLTLGLNPQEIKNNIIKPYLEKAAFTKVLLKDPTFLQQQKKIAEQLRIDLSKNPSTFSNENTYASLAVAFYDLGYIQTASLAGDFMRIASLDTGEISDVIEDAQSYSLFRVTEKLPTENDSSSGYISLQKIEIKKINADLWIDYQLQSIRTAVFNPSLSWNSACLQMTPGDSCIGLSSSGNTSVSLDSLYNALTGDTSIFLPSFSDL